MYTLQIFKNQIPYETRLEIGGGLFILKFKYNLYDERVYADLFDLENNLLVEDEPIVLGVPLFSRYYIDIAQNIRNGFPKALIIPDYIDSRTDKITFNNIEDVRLYVEELWEQQH